MSEERFEPAIPDNVPPEVRAYMEKIYTIGKEQPDLSYKNEYGHHLLDIATSLRAAASKDLGWSLERQRANFRKIALKDLKIYGPKYIEGFMRDELMAALTPDDIEKIKSGVIPEV